MLIYMSENMLVYEFLFLKMLPVILVSHFHHNILLSHLVYFAHSF